MRRLLPPPGGAQYFPWLPHWVESGMRERPLFGRFLLFGQRQRPVKTRHRARTRTYLTSDRVRGPGAMLTNVTSDGLGAIKPAGLERPSELPERPLPQRSHKRLGVWGSSRCAGAHEAVRRKIRVGNETPRRSAQAAHLRTSTAT